MMFDSEGQQFSNQHHACTAGENNEKMKEIYEEIK
jgi:hypothetical protein